ncbi:MAG: hypothetical protein KAQ92_08740, partial [Candidatus Aenigmarchaeota archaeon]|nr:hypothetical protein [Candidatus Aenigmarchaeota archaeon]
NRYKDLVKSLGIEEQLEKISTEEEVQVETDGTQKKRRRKKIISKFKSSQLKSPTDFSSDE